MSVQTTTENGLCRIDIIGEMTIYAALQIKEALLAAMADCQKIEINLSQVSEIDASGLQLLALARREALARSLPLDFAEPSHVVQDMLTLCGLEKDFCCREAHLPA